MFLRSVRLANFRAVKSARISFDPTTVLIGENDCGRSSIMEAIALALGWNSQEGEFLFQPFHLHRANDQARSARNSRLGRGCRPRYLPFQSKQLARSTACLIL